jgi:hypothetical protein
MGGTVAGLAFKIIAHYFDGDWFATHIRRDAPKRGYLNLDFASDQRREASTFRIVEFAENLLNLQHIEGFNACLAQMRGGAEKIESTCAELDFGRLLYIHDIDFRFIVPQMVKGADYDFEIIYRGRLNVAADAKCKFETAAINPDSLRSSMKKGRGQLPAGQAGIIFIKVPQRWIENPATVEAMIAVARQFLTTTGRVVSIKFYASHLQIGNGMVLHCHAFSALRTDSSQVVSKFLVAAKH